MSEPHCPSCTCAERDPRAWMPDWAVHPGETLKECIADWKLPQKAIARQLGITEAYLSDVLRGRRAVSPELALRLEVLPGPGAKFWVRMQALYDLTVARQKSKCSRAS